MFEDPDHRARQTSAQDEGRVIQLVTQDETTLEGNGNKTMQFLDLLFKETLEGRKHSAHDLQ